MECRAMIRTSSTSLLLRKCKGVESPSAKAQGTLEQSTSNKDSKTRWGRKRQCCRCRRPLPLGATHRLVSSRQSRTAQHKHSAARRAEQKRVEGTMIHIRKDLSACQSSSLMCRGCTSNKDFIPLLRLSAKILWDCSHGSDLVFRARWGGSRASSKAAAPPTLQQQAAASATVAPPWFLPPPAILNLPPFLHPAQ